MTPKKYGTIATTMERYDLSRRTVYDLLADGSLSAVKRGATTLIDLEHADAYFASLPRAVFRPQRTKQQVAA